MEMLKKRYVRLGWITGVIILAFSTAHAQGTLSLPQTGQTKCYNSKGDVVDCKGTGQDGETRVGAAWPKPRFTNLDGSMPINGPVVADQLTGLMWARDAGTPTIGSCSGGGKDWPRAIEYVNCLNSRNYLGYSDWRLPNVHELEILVNLDSPVPFDWMKAQGFVNVLPYSYWTSTESSNTHEDVLIVFFRSGLVSVTHKWNYSYYVWPVRTWAPPGKPAPVWKTGQTFTSATGDDGDLRVGVPWPDPRFTDHGNGTVTDNLTGLMWTKDLNSPEIGSCRLSKMWQGALDYVACLNSRQYLGYTDWRLPNRKELLSPLDRSKPDIALPADHPFSKPASILYWSSTTFASSPEHAWFVNIGGIAGAAEKALPRGDLRVWPVRGGLINPAGPHLTGTWTSLVQTCQKSWWKKKRCDINGTFTVKNTGNEEAAPVQVRFYLSETKEEGTKRHLLKELATGKIPAGKSEAIPFLYRFPKGETGSGKHVIAVIGADAVKSEAEKKYMTVVYGPIP